MNSKFWAWISIFISHFEGSTSTEFEKAVACEMRNVMATYLTTKFIQSKTTHKQPCEYKNPKLRFRIQFGQSKPLGTQDPASYGALINALPPSIMGVE
jgi:hypothetical protein